MTKVNYLKNLFIFIVLICFIFSFAISIAAAQQPQTIKQNAESKNLTHNFTLVAPQLSPEKAKVEMDTILVIPNIIVANQKIEDQTISLEIHSPELNGKNKIVKIKKEAQKITIESDDVAAFTIENVELKDTKIYLIHGEKKLEIKVLPITIYEKIKIAEPQIIHDIELKIEDEKPIYVVDSLQSMDVEDGIINIEIISKFNAETGDLIEIQKVIKKDDMILIEADKDLPLIWDNQLVKLENVNDKEIKREKLFVKFVKPIVKLEKIQSPILVKKEKLILQTEKDCSIRNKKLILETDNYDLVAVETDNIQELLENDCVLKIADEQNKNEFVIYSKEILEVETEEKIRKLELKKNIGYEIELQ